MLLAMVAAMVRKGPASPASQAPFRHFTGGVPVVSLTRASGTIATAESPLAVAAGLAAFGQAALVLALSLRVPGVPSETRELYDIGRARRSAAPTAIRRPTWFRARALCTPLPLVPTR